MTTAAGTTAPANIAPAVWARYMRLAIASHLADTIIERANAAYEASHLAAQLGIDEAAIEPEVLAEVRALLPAPVRRLAPVVTF